MEVGNAPRATAAQYLLAGLESGVIAVLAMLGWLGVLAVWYRHSFWTAPNLLASTFYGQSAIRNHFTLHTFSGLAFYLLIYASLGMLFALAIQDRPANLRITCIGILGAIGFYYLLFDVVWKTWNPLLALYTQDRPMFAAHVLYGAILGRYPATLARLSPKGEPAFTHSGAAPAPVSDQQP